VWGVKKKMSESEKIYKTNNSQLFNYLPPELHTGKETYIDYYVIKPGESVLYRKRIKLNRAKTKLTTSDFKRYCRGIIKNLSEKLASGWNPFIEQEAGKGFTTLSAALDTYFNDKSREMTDNSIRSYKSFISMLKDYLKTVLKDENIFCINFNQEAARNYLLWCWNEKGIEGRTFNGYIRGYHSIWAWLVEFNYSKVNVFDGITRKKEKKKNRIEINSNLRAEIKQHLLEQSEAAYWLMCELCFFGLIRPSEMVRLKVNNVDLEKQIIVLNFNETKNQQERICSLPNHVAALLTEHLKRANSDDFLFSDRGGYLPGKNELDSRKIAKRWEKLRVEIGFGKNIQFYSQRDSGIIYMLDTINPEYVRSQADHYSLEMTTKYTKHFRPEGNRDIMNIEPDI
jgi:integrase